MESALTIQGRQIGAGELATIQQLISSHPQWHRTRISQELCREWNWCNEAGRLKDIAARSLLRKLDHQGLIQLPAAVRSANNAFRNRPLTQLALDLEPVSIEGRLSDLQPLRIDQVTQAQELRLLRGLLQQHHYLGYGGPVGENLKYLVYDRQARLLACLLYGAAAWRVASRDRFIGWDESARQCGLSRIANNMRFLILPDIRVPHLASHLLALISRRISSDWQAQYGHPILLLETFVEQPRFAGTCYKAANWIRVGQTTGRTRNHRRGEPRVPVKSIWLYPLCRRFRQRLMAPTRNLG
ncbi:MAG: DUF4338 domain-containing protein [Proteobacteria bacterium]|nr:DUF4338 domain-containing protein [Pseudomonadota bacterium]